MTWRQISRWSLLHLTGALLIGLGVLSASRPVFATDVTITPIGQASDGMLLKVLMKGQAVEPDYDSTLSAQGLRSQKVIIAVVGGSPKGLGAAGITVDQERHRSTQLLLEARRRGIRVLLLHIGGARRRGGWSDTFIEATKGLADRVVVVSGGNSDGIFTRGRLGGAALVEVETPRAAVAVLSVTLEEWGVK